MNSKRLFIILTFFLSFLFIAGNSYASIVFQDQFNSSPISSSWRWENPGGTSSQTVSGGTWNLTVGAVNDQWININKAPRILKTQPTGNWTIETRVTSNTGNAQTFGGLTVFKDQANWLLWGQLGNSTLEGSGIINNAFTEPITTMATKYNYLRIRKISNTYYFDASPNGTKWTNANIYTDTTNSLSGARVGILAKSWSSTKYTIKFDYYKEDNTDLMPSALSNTVTTTQIAKETGADSINQTDKVKICGTDLGEMFDWLGKVFIAFGDTNRCDGGSWPSNVLSYTTDTTPGDGLIFDGWATDSTGMAKELFPEDTGTITSIPTHGVGIDNTAYLYYMSVDNWTPPAPQKWTCSRSSIATAQSTDIGKWTKQPISWSSGSFNVVAIVRESNTLYIWGTPCGRFGTVKLMKVDTSSILNKSAYRYFSGYDSVGNPVWSTSESAAISIAGSPVGEISVQFNTWLNRYIMTYLDESKGALVLRESPTPWGGWSAPITLTTSSQYPALYGAFLHPKYVENNGESIYYMMSMFGPYNTYLMKSTLVKK